MCKHGRFTWTRKISKLIHDDVTTYCEEYSIEVTDKTTNLIQFVYSTYLFTADCLECSIEDAENNDRNIVLQQLKALLV